MVQYRWLKGFPGKKVYLVLHPLSPNSGWMFWIYLPPVGYAAFLKKKYTNQVICRARSPLLIGVQFFQTPPTLFTWTFQPNRKQTPRGLVLSVWGKYVNSFYNLTNWCWFAKHVRQAKARQFRQVKGLLNKLSEANQPELTACVIYIPLPTQACPYWF